MSNTSSDLSPWEYQVVALAGIAQSAALVHGLASTGRMSENAAIASVNSLLVLNPASTKDVYPHLGQWSLGLQTVQTILSNSNTKENAQIARYMLGLMILRGKFMANSAMQHHVRLALEDIEPLSLTAATSHRADDQTEPVNADLHVSVETTFEQLASLYQDTISKLPYRIQVQGKIEHLKHEQTANKIRALLLAGLRSAVLWHQLGGRRWRLLFYRNRIHNTTTAIRRKLIVTV